MIQLERKHVGLSLVGISKHLLQTAVLSLSPMLAVLSLFMYVTDVTVQPRRFRYASRADLRCVRSASSLATQNLKLLGAVIRLSRRSVHNTNKKAVLSQR